MGAAGTEMPVPLQSLATYASGYEFGSRQERMIEVGLCFINESRAVCVSARGAFPVLGFRAALLPAVCQGGRLEHKRRFAACRASRTRCTFARSHLPSLPPPRSVRSTEHCLEGTRA